MEIVSIRKLKKEAFRKLNCQMAQDQLAFVQRLSHDNRLFMPSLPNTDDMAADINNLQFDFTESTPLDTGSSLAEIPLETTVSSDAIDSDNDVCILGASHRRGSHGIEALLDGMCGISVSQDDFDQVLEFEQMYQHHYDPHYLDAAIGDLF
ncbi:hypothetical protein BDEG_27699 [Batrachochytrium dendrobatidis JEL423]|nr:hypothetical protein BDEG_27699 [Batrachochytrium dendrobatidis JEL423]